jgi:hypothetical protein
MPQDITSVILVIILHSCLVFISVRYEVSGNMKNIPDMWYLFSIPNQSFGGKIIIMMMSLMKKTHHVMSLRSIGRDARKWEIMNEKGCEGRGSTAAEVTCPLQYKIATGRSVRIVSSKTFTVVIIKTTVLFGVTPCSGRWVLTFRRSLMPPSSK